MKVGKLGGGNFFGQEMIFCFPGPGWHVVQDHNRFAFLFGFPPCFPISALFFHVPPSLLLIKLVGLTSTKYDKTYQFALHSSVYLNFQVSCISISHLKI